MKIVLCKKCWDAFKVEAELRHCKCGASVGIADINDGEGGRHVYVDGPVRVIGIDNNLLQFGLDGGDVRAWIFKQDYGWIHPYSDWEGNKNG